MKPIERLYIRYQKLAWGYLLILLLLQSFTHASWEAAEHAGGFTDVGQRSRPRQEPANIESGPVVPRAGGCVFIDSARPDSAASCARRGVRQE